MRISSNIEVILAKQDDMKEDILDLTQLKNRHEERLVKIERLIPDDLDSRLRNLEINIKQYTFIVSIIVSIIITVLTKIASGLIS